MKQALREDLIRIKLCEMEEGVALVVANLPDDAPTFQSMGLVKDGIYKRMEFVIENVLDICAILNADLKFGLPGADEDILDHLVENKILSDSLVRSVRCMKGFRNIVVHRYGRIDDELAYSVLLDHLGDFDTFKAEIEAFLACSEQS